MITPIRCIATVWAVAVVLAAAIKHDPPEQDPYDRIRISQAPEMAYADNLRDL